MRFLVVAEPPHVYPEVERIVEANDRYIVVEKIEAAAVVAAEHDPRAGG